MVAAASVDEPLDEAMPAALPESDAEPAAIKHGAFHDADDVHHGSGTATIYALPDGSHVLRLDDLDVTNGPDLFVVVSPHPDPTNGDELHAEGYATLEGLKGNKGSQNYTIPADLDVAVQQSVAIYCRAFGVLFAVAPLEQAQITQ